MSCLHWPHWPGRCFQEAGEKGISSGLEYIDYWLHTIHLHTARNTRSGAGAGAAVTRLSPPVFVIGTHRRSLHHDNNVCQQMVRTFLKDVIIIVACRGFKLVKNWDVKYLL